MRQCKFVTARSDGPTLCIRKGVTADWSGWRYIVGKWSFANNYSATLTVQGGRREIEGGDVGIKFDFRRRRSLVARRSRSLAARNFSFPRDYEGRGGTLNMLPRDNAGM